MINLKDDGFVNIPEHLCVKNVQYLSIMSDGIHLIALNTLEDCHQYCVDYFLPVYSNQILIFNLVKRIALSPAFTNFPSSLYNQNFETIKLMRHSGTYFVGQYLDVQDSVGKWCVGNILSISGNKLLIHYQGWASKWDESIDMNSKRIARYLEYTGRNDPSSQYRKDKYEETPVWKFCVESLPIADSYYPIGEQNIEDCIKLKSSGWEFKPTWVSYDVDVSLILESAYIAWKTSHSVHDSLSPYQISIANQTFLVNFELMVMVFNKFTFILYFFRLM